MTQDKCISQRIFSMIVSAWLLSVFCKNGNIIEALASVCVISAKSYYRTHHDMQKKKKELYLIKLSFKTP